MRVEGPSGGFILRLRGSNVKAPGDLRAPVEFDFEAPRGRYLRPRGCDLRVPVGIKFDASGCDWRCMCDLRAPVGGILKSRG